MITIILGALTLVFFFAAATIEDIGKLDAERWPRLARLRRGSTIIILKIIFGIIATGFGVFALMHSAQLQKQAEAERLKIQTEADAANRKHQQDEIKSAGCSLAREIELNKKILGIKLAYTSTFTLYPTPHIRRVLARTLREGGVHSIEFDSRSHQLAILGDARKPIVDVYSMFSTLAKTEQAFLHDLDDPSVNLRDAVEKAKSQRVEYSFVYLTVAQEKLPVVQKLCVH